MEKDRMLVSISVSIVTSNMPFPKKTVVCMELLSEFVYWKPRSIL